MVAAAFGFFFGELAQIQMSALLWEYVDSIDKTFRQDAAEAFVDRRTMESAE